MNFANINLNETIKVLAEYQKNGSDEIKLNFVWNNATLESVVLSPQTQLYNWLYPIEFPAELAFILELIQKDIYCILENREKMFKLICFRLGIKLDYFYQCIVNIQNILIDCGRVKLCNDGNVILMYEW